jgi:hypothetical protein
MAAPSVWKLQDSFLFHVNAPCRAHKATMLRPEEWGRTAKMAFSPSLAISPPNKLNYRQLSK